MVSDLQYLIELVNDCDSVIISDYAKGVFSQKIIDRLVVATRNRELFWQLILNLNEV